MLRIIIDTNLPYSAPDLLTQKLVKKVAKAFDYKKILLPNKKYKYNKLYWWKIRFEDK